MPKARKPRRERIKNPEAVKSGKNIKVDQDGVEDFDDYFTLSNINPNNSTINSVRPMNHINSNVGDTDPSLDIPTTSSKKRLSNKPKEITKSQVENGLNNCKKPKKRGNKETNIMDEPSHSEVSSNKVSKRSPNKTKASPISKQHSKRLSLQVKQDRHHRRRKMTDAEVKKGKAISQEDGVENFEDYFTQSSIALDEVTVTRSIAVSANLDSQNEAQLSTRSISTHSNKSPSKGVELPVAADKGQKDEHENTKNTSNSPLKDNSINKILKNQSQLSILSNKVSHNKLSKGNSKNIRARKKLTVNLNKLEESIETLPDCNGGILDDIQDQGTLLKTRSAVYSVKSPSSTKAQKVKVTIETDKESEKGHVSLLKPAMSPCSVMVKDLCQSKILDDVVKNCSVNLETTNKEINQVTKNMEQIQPKQHGQIKNNVPEIETFSTIQLRSNSLSKTNVDSPTPKIRDSPSRQNLKKPNYKVDSESDLDESDDDITFTNVKITGSSNKMNNLNVQVEISNSNQTESGSSETESEEDKINKHTGNHKDGTISTKEPSIIKGNEKPEGSNKDKTRLQKIVVKKTGGGKHFLQKSNISKRERRSKNKQNNYNEDLDSDSDASESDGLIYITKSARPNRIIDDKGVAIPSTSTWKPPKKKAKRIKKEMETPQSKKKAIPRKLSTIMEAMSLEKTDWQSSIFQPQVVIDKLNLGENNGETNGNSSGSSNVLTSSLKKKKKKRLSVTFKELDTERQMSDLSKMPNYDLNQSELDVLTASDLENFVRLNTPVINTPNARRSVRKKIPILKPSTQKVIYVKKKDGNYAAVGIQTKPPIKKPIHPKRVTGKVKREETSISIHDQSVIQDMGEIQEVDLKILDPNTNEEVPYDLYRKNKNLVWTGPTLLNAQANDPFVLTKAFESSNFSIGLLKIRGRCEKPTQLVQYHNLIFSVKRGKILVEIHNSQFIIESSDFFCVPDGNTYSLKNLRNDEASLYFHSYKTQDLIDSS